MKTRNFELKDETVLEIGKFAVLWNWFEKTFCNNNCNYNRLKESIEFIKIDETKQKRLAEVFDVRKYKFCHFIHPNHSKHFYSFLAMLMPDWKERKTVLDRSATFWL